MLTRELLNPNSFIHKVVKSRRQKSVNLFRRLSKSLEGESKDLYSTGHNSTRQAFDINFARLDSFLEKLSENTGDGLKISRNISRAYREADYPIEGVNFQNFQDISSKSFSREIVSLLNTLDNLISLHFKLSDENESEPVNHSEKNGQEILREFKNKKECEYKSNKLEQSINKLSKILNNAFKYLIDNNDKFKQYFEALFLRKNMVKNPNPKFYNPFDITDPDLVEAVFQSTAGDKREANRNMKIFLARRKNELKHLFRAPRVILRKLDLNLDLEGRLDFYRLGAGKELVK